MKDMEESFAWKIIYLAAIFSLLVLGIAYLFISPRESAYFSEEKTEKIAEFKDARIEGRKEGKKVWEFFARDGWTEKSQQITHLRRVRRGRIFKDGKILVSDLHAPYVNVYRRAEVIEAFGQVKCYIDLGKISSQPKRKNEWTKMVADRIKYVPEEKKSEITGEIVLSKRDSVIYAQKINVDHERKIADLSEKISIDRKDGVVRADAIQYLGEEEKLNASGKVSLELSEGRIKTHVKCDRGILFLDANQDISLSGNLEAAQGRKLAVAQEGTYSRQKKNLFLKGETRTIIEKAEAILKAETVKNLQNPEVKNILKEKTVVSAKEISFSTQTGDASAAGSVEVSQKGREAKSASAYYDDKREILKLSGSVSMKKEADWITCREVIISVKKETFEASGVAEARFRL